MEITILIIFILGLTASVSTKVPIIYALLFGYLLFSAYALKKGYSVKGVLKMSFEGIKTTKNILITFMLIGVLTALWRAGGTIGAIISYSEKLISPKSFVIAAFLLNCLVSFLTGTAFGTAATMGAICMTIAYAMGINPLMVGGAVLSGSYFGDRCSPVSTSALLVSEITKTDIYKNIKNMMKTASVPFLISCIIYIVYGVLIGKGSISGVDAAALFKEEFNIGILSLLPAAVMLILSLFKVKVKITMASSILAAVLICILREGMLFSDILKFAVTGFKAENAAIAEMIDGGGLLSMINVASIVCLSSCYSGIFRETGLLDGVKKLIERAGERLPSYTVIFLTSVINSMVSCNQTLAIMLTEFMCGHIEKDKEKLAINLENSAVVIAPLVPWSIACSVTLLSSGAPAASPITAFFLYLLPVYSLITAKRNKKEPSV